MTILYITENNTKRYGVAFQTMDVLKYRNLKTSQTMKKLYIL